MIRSAVRSLGLMLALCAGIHAEVSVVSYFGGTGDDAVTGAAIASDGSIILAGTSTSAAIAGVAGNRLAAGNGFVAKLNRDGTALQWLVRLPPVKKIRLDASDKIYLLLDSSVAVLAFGGSAFVRQGASLGAVTTDLGVAPDGSAAVLAGGTARFLEPAGTERWSKSVGRSSCLSIAIDPVSKDVWVGGDQNTNTGYEPWRSPFLFQYTAAAGDRTTVLYNWPGPAVRENGLQLQSDSSIRLLKFTADGRLWIGAWSDGGNTVLRKEPDSLLLNQDALAGTCFPDPCFGYKGAKSTGMFARMKSPITDMERGSWVIPYVGMAPGSHLDPPCGCKGANFGGGTGVNPGSFGVSGILPVDNGVIVLGNPWGKGPATSDGWFYNTVYMGGGIGWMGVFTEDLTQITEASMIPGTRDAYGDYQGGRLVVAGKAADFSTAVLDTAEADWDADLPTTQGALQTAFAGGASDGYFVVACMSTSQECGAATRNGDGPRGVRGGVPAPVLTARGIRLGAGPRRGTYALMTASGSIIDRGPIPDSRLIRLDRGQVGGIFVLRVAGMGTAQTWRIYPSE